MQSLHIHGTVALQDECLSGLYDSGRISALILAVS